MTTSVITIDQRYLISRNPALSNAAWILGFTVLTAVGAQVAIPTLPVPFTLQSFFVLLSGALLGPRKAAAAQLSYLAAGAAGLPVFAGFSGGIFHMAGPSGGYLLAFPLAAFIAGAGLRVLGRIPMPLFVSAFLSMLAALAVIFACGTAQLNLLFLHDWSASVQAGLVVFTVWDLVKAAAAAGIASEALRRLRRS